METLAVLFDKPESVGLRSVVLEDPPDDALVVETEWSGISTGTERLLFTGRMPPFPGLGYPLVPGYESVGRVVRAPRGGAYREGERVFVPGATCYRDVRGLFGGAAARLICDPGRARRLDPRVAAFADAHAEQGV
ncbi:MAG: chlorophyll synthesis pathway protein BchC, partial [Myxococcota bacterium]